MFFFVLACLVLFLSAGDWLWSAGWWYLGMTILVQVLTAAALISISPDLLEERSKLQAGTKNWDKILAPAVTYGMFVIWIVSGLDHRLSLSSPASQGVQVAGLLVGFVGSLFTLWAMATNRFFASTVRIQSDRGQTVCSDGPYRIVRHPGYLGAVVFDLVTPLALGTWWGLVPALLVVGLIIFRTSLEDRTLQAELPGYADFARKPATG